MSWAIVASVGGSIISGMMTSDAAGDAAEMQREGTREATAENRRQFDLIRSDQAPFRDLGVSSISALRKLMGWSDTGPASIAQQIGPRPQRGEFMRSGTNMGAWVTIPDTTEPGKHILGAGVPQNPDGNALSGTYMGTDDMGNPIYSGFRGQPGGVPVQGGPGVFDEEAYNRAVAEYDKKLAAAEAAAKAAAGERDPYQVYGEGPLNKRFTVEDFWADPVTKLGFQTGMDLGTKALRNAAPLTTGMDSGAALKELTKFGTDYTGLKAGESYGRFEGEKSNVFNRLMAMIGGGQIANQVNAAAGTNFANTNANLVTAGANAQGAARIAQGNAWSSGIGRLQDWWNQKQMVDRVFPQGGGARTPSFGNWAGIPAEYDYGYGGT